MNLLHMGQKAREVFPIVASATSEVRSQAVRALAAELENNFESIRNANDIDISEGRKNGLAGSLIDRLTLSPERLECNRRAGRGLHGMPQCRTREIPGHHHAPGER